MLRNLHCILYMVEKAMQIAQGSLCSRNVCATYGLNQCPSFFQAPWCHKEDHTPYPQRMLLLLRLFSHVQLCATP